MTSWNRWSKGALLLLGAMSLSTAGCLSDDPNMDGNSGTEGTSADSGNGPGNGPGGTVDETGTNPGTDGETENGPGGTENTGDPVTIYDIQMGLVPEGTVVSISGAVVTSPVLVADGGVTVADPMGGPYSGIYLYLYEEVVNGVPLNPGDEVTFTGEYTEFFDFSQITITAVDQIQVTGTATMPDPVTVAPADVAVGGADSEAYESVVVRVENVVATDATNQFGDFHVDDNLVICNKWLFEQGGQLDVLAGSAIAFAQGPLLYAFEEFKICPRTAADYDATLVACADAATPATIQEIQQGTIAEGTLVSLENVVVTTPWDFGGDTFWVQDPGGGAYSGISVYLPGAASFVPNPGDVVSICGEYAEYFDQSQLQIAAESDVSASGNGPVPAPEVLSADVVGGGAMAEQWEGVLVRIDGPSVTTAANMFGEWVVDDVLTVDDVFFAMMNWPNPAVGTVYTSLTGVMTYSFGAFKLAPRTNADIVQ